MTAIQPLTSRVVDAAPLIGLAKVGRLDVLTAGARTAIVTDTIVREVEAGREDDPARMALQRGWGIRREDILISDDLTAWNLDAGEQSIPALAKQIGAVAVLDDGAGRKAARALGIIHTGTTGLVIEAKRQGVITSAADLLRQLRNAGLYLPSEAILHTVLHTIGENWP